MDTAHVIYVVMTADLPCLKNVRLVLETIGHLGYTDDKIKLISESLERFHRDQRQERRERAEATDRFQDHQRLPRRDHGAQQRGAVHVYEANLGPR